MLAFFNALSPMHLLVIGVIALLLFGNRLPEVARSLGKAVNEFKRGLKDVQEDLGRDDDEEEERPPEQLETPRSQERIDQQVTEPRESRRREPVEAKRDKDFGEGI